MVIEWIGYCLALAAFFGVAALAGERALSHYRKPVRFAWGEGPSTEERGRE